jgi:hypothetical protein
MTGTPRAIASLKGVAVARRVEAVEAVGKPGDITDQLSRAAAAAAAAAPKPAPPPAPPPPAPAVAAPAPEPQAAPAPTAAAPVPTPPAPAAWAPVPQPPAPVAPVSVEPAPVVQHGTEGILVYWQRLRGPRQFPALDSIDRGFIAQAWPDSLLVAFEPDDTALPRISRLGKGDSAIEYTTMVTNWILSRARQAARHGEALDEAQRFPTDAGNERYRLLLLPLGGRDGGSDCVLCHLSLAA